MTNFPDLVQALITAPEHDPNSNLSLLIPGRTGIYVWFTVQEDKIVYVGTATGELVSIPE